MSTEAEEFLGLTPETTALPTDAPNTGAEVFLGIRPDIDKQSLRRRYPIFGAISLIAPLAGIPFAYIIASNTSAEGEGWGHFVAFVMIVFLSLLGGGISAIIGLVRSEEYLILSLIGLFLNLMPILWLLSH
jgi:hypothetical protein